MTKLSIIKRIFMALVFPLGVFLITEVSTLIIFGTHLFVSPIDYNNFLRSVGITSLAGFALSINFTAGMMDLSLGGQQLIGCLIGGNLAISMGFGPVGVIVMCMLFSALAGLVSGLVFVTLRLQTFVTGIGMALIYEAISNAFAPEGLMIFGNENLSVLSSTMFIFLVSLAIIVSLHFILNRSVYGLRYNSIKGSLRVSMNSGLPVNWNVLLNFIICGMLIGLSGILNAGYSSYMAPSLNLSSLTNVFAGFTAVFAAMFMRSFCPMTIGIPLAVIAFKLINIFLVKFSMPSKAATAITMIILLLLLVLMAMVARKELTAKYKLRSKEI